MDPSSGFWETTTAALTNQASTVTRNPTYTQKSAALPPRFHAAMICHAMIPSMVSIPRDEAIRKGAVKWAPVAIEPFSGPMFEIAEYTSGVPR